MSLRGSIAPVGRGLLWLIDASAAGVAVAQQGVRPVAWRRTVRAEFQRFLDVAGVQGLSAVLFTAVLVGLSLVAQATFWFDRLGDPDLVRSVIATVLVREIAPLLVGLLVIGRGGLEMLSDISTARHSGLWRTLAAQGIDPFLLLVVPRVLALALCTFCLSSLFIFVTLATGYLAARAVGVSTLSPGDFVVSVLHAVGATGYLLLPVKTLLLGFVIGLVCALTSLEDRPKDLLARGFMRCTLAVLLVSGLSSAVL